jgi:hypothetical protein
LGFGQLKQGDKHPCLSVMLFQPMLSEKASPLLKFFFKTSVLEGFISYKNRLTRGANVFLCILRIERLIPAEGKANVLVK